MPAVIIMLQRNMKLYQQYSHKFGYNHLILQSLHTIIQFTYWNLIQSKE